MRRFCGSVFLLLIRLIYLLAVVVPLMYVASFVVHLHLAQPWPGSARPLPVDAEYLKVDVYNGRFAVSRIQALEPDVALANQADPVPVGGYARWNLGPVPTERGWRNLGAVVVWSRGGRPLSAVVLIAAVGLLLWLGRRVYIKWTEVRVPTNYCLNCATSLVGVEGHACPKCGAERPWVTVSSR